MQVGFPQTRRGVSPRGVCRPCAARARASTVAASTGLSLSGPRLQGLGLERGLRLRRGLRASDAASRLAEMPEVKLPHRLERRLPSDIVGTAGGTLRAPPRAPGLELGLGLKLDGLGHRHPAAYSSGRRRHPPSTFRSTAPARPRAPKQ
eukprot:scaffold114508_cov56-Phaeocystis_antarctica.AAC.3